MKFLLLAMATAVAAVPPTAPLDPVYLERLAEVLANRGELKAYSPLEAVPGAPRPTVFPAATRPAIDPGALEAAQGYAAANRSNAFIVWRDGKIEAEHYFGGATADTPIVSKSLAKPMTALAVGRAIALGKIRSLDQAVADFIPEWRGTAKAAMKVRHLLDMRSGLLAQGFDAQPDNPWSRAYLDPDHTGYIVASYPLTDPPGSAYQYANAPSELVALVIERATGRRYAEFVGNELLKPIGAPGGQVWVNRRGGVAHSGCCMLLPPRAWLNLAVLVMQDGVWRGRRLLPKGYVAAMRTPTAQNPYYGVGLWVAGRYTVRRGFANPALPLPKVLHSEPYLARDLVLFDGNSNQTVYIVPSARLIVLRSGDSPPKAPEWDNAFLPNTLLRGMGYRGPAQPRERTGRSQ